ncbi:MAG: hypothetical protein AB7I59_27820 [Geminicoccaceae bacterium]
MPAANHEQQPQPVTVHGQDGAAQIGVDHGGRVPPVLTGAAIVAALHESPLREIEIERVSVRASVRDVEL